MTDVSTPLIQADGLAKYYGRFTAIEEVDFTVSAGTITAFLGPNGAGKSTTLKILTGYLAPSAGVARIAGHDMQTDRLAGAQQLGYLGENGPLYPDMTPASYLRYVGKIRNLGGPTLKAALERVAADCELAEVWSKPIRKLSKGFRQRVGLAQALLHDPQVLILDEPTSGLDPNQIIVVRDLIKKPPQLAKLSCCRPTSCKRCMRWLMWCCSSRKAVCALVARRKNWPMKPDWKRASVN